MAFCASVLVWGWVFKGHFFTPGIVLLGLLAMRFLDTYAEPRLFEVGAGAVWISVAFLLFYQGWYFTGGLLCLSGLTYPVLRAFGCEIETLGFLPVVADTFFVCALLVMAGGAGGLSSHSDPRRDSDRFIRGAERSASDLAGHRTAVVREQTRVK